MQRQWFTFVALIFGACQGSETTAPTLVLFDAQGGDAALGQDTASPGPGADVDHADDVEAIPSCDPNQCTIEGACIEDGDSHPDNPCLGCFVAQAADEWTADDSSACDDGNACTADDRCADGECVGAAKSCADGNPCTTDSCDPESGQCSSTVNTARCDDADPCTTDDVCANGVCGGGAETCNDKNPCTSDSCDRGVCSHAATAGTCDDQDLCTTGDHCANGICRPGEALTCTDGDVCTADACDPVGGCHHLPLLSYCLDENPCTNEGCDPTFGCVYPYNTEECDDGSVCTTGDTCDLGACHGALVEESDNNPCTDDSCDPVSGVRHQPNSLPCEDGDLCTLGDVCGSATCHAGDSKPICNDGNPCTDDACEPAVGCVAPPNTDPCDDNSVCTTEDTCGSGSCIGHTVSCDDANACTTESCDPVDGCANTLIVSNACRPDIVVTYPERGATIKGSAGSSSVVVTGTVSSGAGPITSLTLNGQAVTVGADGAFSMPVTAETGGNTLVFQSLDALGGSKKRVQAFHWSTSYKFPKKNESKSGMTDQALGIWLSKAALQKLTQALQGLVSNIDIGAAIPSPALSTDQYNVFLKNLTYSSPTVAMEPINGGIQISVQIKTIKGNIDAQGKKIGCAFGICTYYPNASGTISIATLSATANVALSVTPGHALKATVGAVSVTMSDPNVQLDGIIGFLASPIINLIVPLFKGSIEGAFEDVLGDAIGPLVESALSGLALSLDFSLPSLDPTAPAIAIQVETDFHSVAFSPAGGALVLRGGAYSDVKTPYVNLGVPQRGTCGADGFNLTLPKATPLELALADDLINQVLFAAWRGGLLEFDVPASLLGGVDLSAFGIGSIDVHVSAMLAPVVSDCAGGEPIVHIGDLRIDAGLDLFGNHMDVVMFVSLRTKIVFSLADGELGFALSDIESVESDISVVQESLVGSESTVADLVNATLIPSLIGSLGGGALASIPLPEIDVSGVKIAIEPTSLTRKPGETLVSGNLK